MSCQWHAVELVGGLPNTRMSRESVGCPSQHRGAVKLGNSLGPLMFQTRFSLDKAFMMTFVRSILEGFLSGSCFDKSRD